MKWVLLQNQPIEVPRFVADVRLCSGAVSYESSEVRVHGGDRDPTIYLAGSGSDNITPL